MTVSRQARDVTSPRYLDRGEGRIAYQLLGPEGGPLVVMAPGMGDLRSAYRFLAPAVADAGYRVATMDLRGHGDSDATFGRYDDVVTGQDMLALAAELTGGRSGAVLVGNSMSSGSAAWAAAEQPEAVAGLVLTGPFVRNGDVSALQRLMFQALISGPWASAAWLSYYPKLYPGRKPEDFDAHRAAIKHSLARRDRRKAFVRTTRVNHDPVEARLHQVHAPTLVVMGEADPDWPDPAAEADYIAGRLSAEVLMVPQAGHYPHAEYPEVVTPRVLQFLARVAPVDQESRA